MTGDVASAEPARGARFRLANRTEGGPHGSTQDAGCDRVHRSARTHCRRVRQQQQDRTGNDGLDDARRVDEATSTAQLVLGALLPQSGDLKAIYKSLNTPITMAVDEINAAGGVNGKPVVLKEADDGTSAHVASSALDTLLTSDKADAIIGPASSTTALGIIDKIKTNGVVDCSGSTTSAALSVAGGAGGGFYFRTAPSDNLQGPALAQLVLSDNKTRSRSSPATTPTARASVHALSKALTDGGADVVANVAYDPKSSDFQADVAKVAGKGADAIVVIGFNDDGGKVLKEMIAQNVGPKNLQIYTADGMQSSSLYKAVDPPTRPRLRGSRARLPRPRRRA